MKEVQVQVPRHDDGVTRELVVQGCLPLLFEVSFDRQNGAAAVGKRSDGMFGVISLGLVLMGIEAIISLIPVQDEVKSCPVIAELVCIPFLGWRLELRHQDLGHLLRGFVC